MPRSPIAEEDLDAVSSEESDEEEEPRNLSRNDSEAGSINVPMSMLSYATVGAHGAADDDFDIEDFREECWRRISTACMGGGVQELASDLDDDEDADDANRIIVAVRTRPINDREIRLGTRGCIEHLSDDRNIIVRKYNWKDEPYDMTFAFDHCFSEDSVQDQVGWRGVCHRRLSSHSMFTSGNTNIRNNATARV